MVSRDLVRRARTDVAVFAEHLIGQPLWEHQLDVLRSQARHRALCSGRQAGKSVTLAVAALHTAFTTPGGFVLILSAGDAAAKDLLATCSALAASSLLSGSVVDDGKSEMTLTNGARIRSIPSSQKQARGPSADLLILDEACFIDDDVWTAARFTVIARPDSKIIMSSTPWGRKDRFFGVTYKAGLAGVAGFESFHWPSTASPLVDAVLLESWRQTDADRVFRAEVLAEWVDDQGAYFTSDELDGAVSDYELVAPDDAGGHDAVAGVDWGFAHDASTIVVFAPVVDGDPIVVEDDEPHFWIPWLVEAFNTPYTKFIDRVVGLRYRHNADGGTGYRLRRVVSEMNGVGQMPTQELTARFDTGGASGVVVGVHTDSKLKEDGFGRLKLLLQQGRLHLPRHPGLLRQLSGLEFEQLDSGATRIAVPDRLGHDDLVMAACLAVHGDPDVGAKRSPRQNIDWAAGAEWGAFLRTDGWGSGSALSEPSPW